MNTFVISGPINHRRVRELGECIQSISDAGTQKLGLDILINSQGGEEHCGRALAGIIKFYRSVGWTINTYGYGDVQSAAVIVFAAGERRHLSRFASVMVHESTSEVQGNASFMKKTAKQMEADEKFWCDLMAELTGTDAKTWLKLHEDESYLRPEEALKLNLATELI